MSAPEPPRTRPVPLLPPEQWTEAMRRAYALLAPLPAPGRAGSNWLSVMVRHPDAFGAWAMFNRQLSAHPAIPERVRELAVLRTGWLCQGAYEWGQHVPKALAAGLTHREIEQVIAGPTDPRWDPGDRAVVQAVDELRSNGVISNPTWAVLAQRLDYEQMIELIMVIGNYHLIAWLHRSLGIALEPGAAGIEAR
ncbi:MAG: carboxymuconolactone decarboxylase family protein [Gammaproteobacteria bacterium]